MQHSIAGRESVISHFTALEVQDRFSMPEVAGNVVVTMDDLSRRLDVYSAQIPEQARWQAELFAMDLAAEYQLDRALQVATDTGAATQVAVESLNRIMVPLEKSLTVAGSVPETMARERTAAIEAFSAEVSRAIQVG